MLVLSNPNTWVPIAVLIASLSGSAHCVSMCGGLVATVVHNKASAFAYHLGRLLGYLSLGGLAGYIGGTVFSGGFAPLLWISWVSSFLLAGGFIFLGIRVWQKKGLHFSILPQKTLQWLYKRAQGNAFASGVLTAFLPCGWLHVFVLGAVSTGSTTRGIIFLLLFWLGTLPALTATPWLVQNVFLRMTRRIPRVAASVLFCAGILSIGHKILPLIPQNANSIDITQPSVMICH